MNALTQIDAIDGITFRQTSNDSWTATIDGKDERTITKDGSDFIAWLGRQDRHWCFQRALTACADHARYHRRVADENRTKHDAAIASLMTMTPEQKARVIDRLETERDLLDYADSEMDVVSRKASIDRRIAQIQGNS